MAAKIYIPTPLRQYAGGGDAVVVEGSTVAEALASLVAAHPGLRKHLFSDDGRLRTFVNVYVNDEDIRYGEGDKTRLADGDSISIVPSIAGGAGGAATPAGANGAPLTNDEALRYSRHLILPEVGVDGQRRLKGARVLMVGAGGLGSPLGLYLAAAGVGTIGIVDFDVVDVTNLQRQIIHGTKDVGRPKLESARDRIRDVNPHVHIDEYETRLSSENALEIVREYDMVIDGTDNFPTRYLVNDACVLTGKPNVYGSIFRFEGQASIFATREGPCYRCLYAEPPPPGLVPSCAEGGVLGVLPGIVGTIQANEAIKLIIGQGETLTGRLLLIDALRMRFRELKVRRNPSCPVCGANPTIRELIDYEEFCGVRPPVAVAALETEFEITPTDLKRRLDRGDRPVMVDVREPHELQISRLDGALLIPLRDIPARHSELDPESEIIVICKIGQRSDMAARFLREQGFAHARNLRGGIDAWARDVDPTLARY
ncbi:MAG: ubiquitin-like small modifier protein 1 [bacterium]